MYLLHLETATDCCSVAISKDAELLVLKEDPNTQAHASIITIMIEACLQKAGITLNDLAAVVVSKGPGSYTALRIGVSTAKGICYALDKPLIAIDTLESLAHAAIEYCNHLDGYYCPMIDARRMEVFCSVYDKTRLLHQKQDSIIIDDTFLLPFFNQGKPIIFCGNGAEKTTPILTHPSAQFISIVCSAKHLISLAWKRFQDGNFEDIAYFEPEYAKAPNITMAKKIL
ncbi:MAG: tRNA ((37)-N6)-threonylcarbamoyltransferase complex dimerization subunit type 1 TsaB [Bacteroidota bacterium]|jgi:tRNA threonylcarbamoyladenosine biosynthesis protein TsaB